MKWLRAAVRRAARQGSAVLLLAMLAGCATAPAPLPALDSLLQDGRFAAPAQLPDPARVFALSAGMQAFLAGDMPRSARLVGVRQGLLDALYSRRQLKLVYDAAYTRTAAEAYAARSGNCLSLVIMTAAFARALDLPVTFNRVSVDEHWRLAGDLMLAAGHVNLSLGRRPIERRDGYDADRSWTIDFLPSADLAHQRSEPVDEATIIGMYMNNRAAESLADGRIDDAYWWAREALRQAPDEIAGYNTLAVVYLRRGLDDAAERVLRLALTRAPANTRLLANLLHLLERQQRPDEQRVVAQRLHALEPVPPYRDYRLGQAALNEGRFDAALALFTQELRQSPDQSEVHFGLARAHLGLGHVSAARRHLEQARDLSSSRGEAALYSAKLGRLGATAQ